MEQKMSWEERIAQRDLAGTFEHHRSVVSIHYESGVDHELAVKEAIGMLTTSRTPTFSYGPPYIQVRTTHVKQTRITIR